MNILGIGRLSRQKVKQVRKLMTLSFSLSHSCTLAAPPSSSHTRFLNLRRPPPPSSIRMSSTGNLTIDIQQGSNAIAADLEPIFKHKKTIRSKVRKSLKEMNPSQRALEDDAIQELILGAPWFKSCKRLCAYISCRALREVDTSKVLAEILQTPDKDSQKLSGKTLYVPRVEDKNSHMRMLNISGMEDLIANSMDILEPAPVDGKGNQREDVMQASEPVDLLLLPGLAFDRAGRRLGRGGGSNLLPQVLTEIDMHASVFDQHLEPWGKAKSDYVIDYYDTFLRNYRQLANERNWKQPLLVALSYSLQILDDGVIPITPNDVYIDALVSPTGVIPISSAALHRMEHGM